MISLFCLFSCFLQNNSLQEYEESDHDGDGYTKSQGDCDDSNPNTHPGTAELESSTGCMVDNDNDGYGSSNIGSLSADGALIGTDCDDSNPNAHPGAAELDSTELCMVDNDEDGYGSSDIGVLTAYGGITGTDCDDNNHALLSMNGDPECEGWYKVLDFAIGIAESSSFEKKLGICVIDNQNSLFCFAQKETIWPLTDPPEGQYVEVVVGRSHGCALDLEGNVQCWGDNSVGQLDAPPNSFLMLTASLNTTCGVTIDHTIECWGDTDDILDANESIRWREFVGGYPYNKIVLSGKEFCAQYADTEIDCNFGDFGYGNYGFASGSLVSFDVTAYHTRSMCVSRVDPSDSECPGATHCIGGSVQDHLPFWSTTCEAYTAVAVSHSDVCFATYPTDPDNPGNEIHCYGNKFFDLSNYADGEYTKLDMEGDLFCALHDTGLLLCQGRASADFEWNPFLPWY